MINLINKGVLIRPNSLNLAEYHRSIKNSITMDINSRIYPGSDFLKNPHELSSQLETQNMMVPITCERKNGKLESKKILPNGDLN